MKNKSGNLPVYRLCSLRTGIGFKTHSIVTVVANKEAWVKTSIYAAMKDVLVCRNNTVFLPNRTSMAEKYSLKRLFRELIVWLCADANNLDLNNIFVDIKLWIKYLFFLKNAARQLSAGVKVGLVVVTLRLPNMADLFCLVHSFSPVPNLGEPILLLHA